MLFSTFGFYRFYCTCASVLFVRHYITLLQSHLNLNGYMTLNKTIIIIINFTIRRFWVSDDIIAVTHSHVTLAGFAAGTGRTALS